MKGAKCEGRLLIRLPSIYIVRQKFASLIYVFNPHQKTISPVWAGALKMSLSWSSADEFELKLWRCLNCVFKNCLLTLTHRPIDSDPIIHRLETGWIFETPIQAKYYGRAPMIWLIRVKNIKVLAFNLGSPWQIVWIRSSRQFNTLSDRNFPL